MKKILYVAGICVVLGVLACGFAAIMGKHQQKKYEEGTKDVLRLHILANSDADYDQQLKLKVKDAVAAKVAEDMKEAGVEDKQQAADFMEKNNARYIELAKEVIKKEGFEYDVTATLGKHWFPVKMYGETVYPEGEYDAYRLLIGSAEGKNWWCVLFPSLCMVDEAYCVEGESMRKDSTQSENEMVGDVSIGDGEEQNEETDDVKIRFKIVEWFESLW